MSTSRLSRLSRLPISLFSVATLLISTLTLPVSPQTAQAAEQAASLADATAAMDANLASLTSQAGDLQTQSAEVGGTITKLEAEHVALLPQIDQKHGLLRDSIKEAYLAGDPSSVEVLASNQTFSGVVGQQHYRDEIGSKTQKAATDLEATKVALQGKLDEAKQKREGLVALQAQLEEKIGTAQAQAEAKAALAEATQGQEEAYQKMVAEQGAADVAAVVAPTASPSPSPAARRSTPSPQPASSGGSVSGVRGNNPYPYGQCTWYVYNQTGRGQMGNAGSWQATSSTPAVGKLMIWRPGQMGATGAGHVGVVIAVSGGSVTVREMNWNGGPGVVSTHTQASTGLFY